MLEKRVMATVFEPVSIGKAMVKNRLVFPSMCTVYSDDRGSITPRIREFVKARAAGGVGTFVLPGTPYGAPSKGRPALSEDSYIQGWEELKGVVSVYGMSLFCQLHHSVVRPGLVRDLRPDEYTLDEIRWIILAFAEGALRAKKAGLDGVEIHGAHASEVAEFLSPFHNRRNDAYGGDLEGRSRLAIETIHAIKTVCGTGFPIIFRFSVEERIQGGRELAESLQLARLLASAGADALSVTVGGRGAAPWTAIPPLGIPSGAYVQLASQVKRAVSIPVIAVGRINDIFLAAKIVARGQADLVAMGRALLADPDLPKKSLEGRRDEIRRCIACNQGCEPVPGKTEGTACLQNPRTGRETTLFYNRVLPGDAKSILVAGAGPAGLEAACVLAERGHRVTVYEQSSKAGGTLLLASKPPSKRGMLEVINCRLKCLRRLGLEVHFNKTVDLKALEDAVPDILVIATGSSPAYPSFAGTNGRGIYSADEVLSGKEPGGKRILLVGNGMVACEVADYLAYRGYALDVVFQSESIASDLPEGRRGLLLERLKRNGVRLIPEAEVLEVELPRARLALGGQQKILGDYDSLVYTSRRPNTRLGEAVSNCPFPIKVFVVGDACRPRTALEAIREAALVAAAV